MLVNVGQTVRRVSEHAEWLFISSHNPPMRVCVRPAELCYPSMKREEQLIKCRCLRLMDPLVVSEHGGKKKKSGSKQTSKHEAEILHWNVCVKAGRARRETRGGRRVIAEAVLSRLP